MTQTVLLAGATGTLGGRIAAHLIEDPEVRLRLLVRPGLTGAKAVAVGTLQAGGAEVVPGDLADPASLDAATEGVDVVVSAVQGGPDVVVDGQVALARAAAAHGARRILPSDFALDLFAAPPGEHPFFDWRRTADAAIADTGLEQVNVLNGAFLDMLVQPRFGGIVDPAAGTVTHWGTGAERFEATTVEDTARYAARAAVDRDLPAGKFAVAGDRVSFAGIAATLEEVTGRPVRRVSRGSTADLERWIADTRAAQGPMAAVIGVYQLYMATGRTALTDLRNDRYPDIVPETFARHARRVLA